ncbi:hypothetical protein RIF29_15312 [Crotalaria pallida]|uniref:Uncharacterized protein n=1 Tax=Crotalaria pallida TaxID=3830 RepID=A0AAN9FH14_CROPI
MSESNDEFEPLFDYSRVQPFNLASFHDDDDEVNVFKKKKKKKVSQPVAEKGKTGVAEVPVVEIEDNDDDDWLPPPPKVSCDTQAG